MDREEIIKHLDMRIGELVEARALVAQSEQLAGAAPPTGLHVVKRHTMSAKGRAAVAEAQRKRWRLKKQNQRIAQRRVLGA